MLHKVKAAVCSEGTQMECNENVELLNVGTRICWQAVKGLNSVVIFLYIHFATDSLKAANVRILRVHKG
jgi:hypothetical protein